ncbi:MAG: translation initiation factor IF-3, translation initiation factor IF-3 [candidate division WWE3 bacterium CSP1-7]|uniref:Translation initiation factor IF-3 n=1 Tax=candidate division WWE3 bacterium CSP1-7 TaxID=1576480 RepID=A0A0T5ZXG2_UNCKA|nr:MAG: translation initiation factor IF-3, translation initiation factor IF-3 [candidate division WWE3 bacterium CSP1-7]
MAIKRPSYRTNEWIRSAELMVIDEDGKQLGVMATRAALEAARSKGLDLVEVAPSAQPPVARIINYKRWLFEREKQKGETTEKRSELKELRFRPNIGENDLRLRARRAEDFLRGGDKVKLTVVFRGREAAHPEIGLEKIRGLAETLKEFGKMEKDPVRAERGYEVTLLPIKRTARDASSTIPRE